MQMLLKGHSAQNKTWMCVQCTGAGSYLSTHSASSPAVDSAVWTWDSHFEFSSLLSQRSMLCDASPQASTSLIRLSCRGFPLRRPRPVWSVLTKNNIQHQVITHEHKRTFPSVCAASSSGCTTTWTRTLRRPCAPAAPADWSACRWCNPCRSPGSQPGGGPRPPCSASCWLRSEADRCAWLPEEVVSSFLSFEFSFPLNVAAAVRPCASPCSSSGGSSTGWGSGRPAWTWQPSSACRRRRSWGRWRPGDKWDTPSSLRSRCSASRPRAAKERDQGYGGCGWEWVNSDGNRAFSPCTYNQVSVWNEEHAQQRSNVLPVHQGGPHKETSSSSLLFLL